MVRKISNFAILSVGVNVLLFILLTTKKLPQVEQLQISSQMESQVMFAQHGEFWVAFNQFPATELFNGNESITLTTPADHSNLDNLVPLVERWNGPVSCAVFAPGSDYKTAVEVITHLRECTSPYIKRFITFHLFFPQDHVPKNIWTATRTIKANCSEKVKIPKTTYRRTQDIVFPINVARNLARKSANTHFVFPSDIELYPSVDFIPQFLQMVADTTNANIHSSRKKVFVLPVFELRQEVKHLPTNKAELKALFLKKQAILFHQNLCPACHNIPGLEKWVRQSKADPDLGVYSVTKRLGALKHWEPFYVGTKDDPVFDERVCWEGGNNKRIQAFVLCLLNYEFHVLDNAFLVHKPGIKYKSDRSSKKRKETISLIQNTIWPELIALYGRRDGCQI